MRRHRFFSLGFVLLLNDALVQCVHVVHSVAGETVTLPCPTSQIKLDGHNVYWRFNDSMTVCDIIRGEVDFDEQHAMYKGKVKYFPGELKGNFSIQLLDVNSAHHGIYTCIIPNVATEMVYLTIEDRRPRPQKLPTHNGDTMGQPYIFLIFSAALLGLYSSCDILSDLFSVSRRFYRLSKMQLTVIIITASSR